MRNITKRVQESRVDSLVTEPIYRAGENVSVAGEGDRPCKSDMSSICSSAVAVEENNNRSKRHSVSFSDEIVVYSIPNKDRKSQWMQMALDRNRFQRRISEFERLFCN